MKKLLVIPMLIIAALTSSCNNSDSNSNYANVYTYATIVEDLTQDSGVSFETDNGESFYVINNYTTATLSKLIVGARIITGVRIDNSVEDLGSYDYAVDLYEIIGVKVGETTTITTETENDDMADDQFSFILKNITLMYGYLNLYVGFQSEEVNDVEFYLVDNTYVTPDETESGYLNLELRYNSGGESGEGSLYETYLSFSVEDFRTQLEGMDGIILRIKTDTSDEIYVTIDSELIFGDDDDEE